MWNVIPCVVLCGGIAQLGRALSRGLDTRDNRERSVVQIHLPPPPNLYDWIRIQGIKRSSFVCWWFDAVGTPVLIPNTEVKHRSTDGTSNGRVGSCQHRKLDILISCPHGPREERRFIFGRWF